MELTSYENRGADSRALMTRPDIGECGPRYSFYYCTSNGFRGCCGLNPCSLKECPDIEVNRLTAEKTAGFTPTTSRYTLYTSINPLQTDRMSIQTEPLSSSPASSSLDISPSRASPQTSESTSTALTTNTARLTTPGAIPSPTDQGNTDNRSKILSSGAIAGIAIGALIVLVLLATLVFRRKCSRQGDHNPTSASFLKGIRFRRTRTQMESYEPSTPGPSPEIERPPNYDPFASFGGRIDKLQVEDSVLPGTFEMEAINPTIPIELPATDDSPNSLIAERDWSVSENTIGVYTPSELDSRDPRATLNNSTTETGTPTYVNHWSQYYGQSSSPRW